MRVTKVSSKGQVVIPKDVRERLGLTKGSRVKVVVEGKKIVMIPLIEPPEEAFVEARPGAVRESVEEAKRIDERKIRRLLAALGMG